MESSEEDQSQSNYFEPYEIRNDSEQEPEPVEVKETRPKTSFTKNYLVSALAAIIALPADYLKSNIIVSAPKQSYSTLINSTISREGIKGFLKGADSLMASKLINVSSHILIKSYALQAALSYRDEKKNLEFLIVLQAASFMAGLASGIFCTPFEAVLVRTQTWSHFKDSDRNYKNFAKALNVLNSEKNLKVIFRGAFGSALVRSFNSSIYSFLLFLNAGSKIEMSTIMKSTFLTCLISAVVYPVEVLRIKIQTASFFQKDVGYYRISQEVLNTFGFKGLYFGFGMFCLNKMIQNLVFGLALF